jgi:HD-GYP domain-containing protein (c-di-GMP phosphodiesterase class II)
MLGLPEAVLQKPGPLTPDEITLVRTHVKIGEEKIHAVRNVEGRRRDRRQHHEREDGSGYLQNSRALR